MLTKEQILAAIDLKIEKVSVPEWGGDVYVKSLTGAERDSVDALVAACGKDSGYPGFRSLMCSLSICDESGKAIFTRSDIPALEKKSAAVLQRVFDKALELNGMSEGAARKAKESFPDASGTATVVPTGVADGGVSSGGAKAD